jgi:hypothetical protein
MEQNAAARANAATQAPMRTRRHEHVALDITVSTLELIPQGEMGGMVIFEDHPNYWDVCGASCSAYILLCRVCCSWDG